MRFVDSIVTVEFHFDFGFSFGFGVESQIHAVSVTPFKSETNPAQHFRFMTKCSSEVLCASELVKYGLENRDYGRRGSAVLTMRHPSIRKSWH
jgi:hypothetical protein